MSLAPESMVVPVPPLLILQSDKRGATATAVQFYGSAGREPPERRQASIGRNTA